MASAKGDWALIIGLMIITFIVLATGGAPSFQVPQGTSAPRSGNESASGSTNKNDSSSEIKNDVSQKESEEVLAENESPWKGSIELRAGNSRSSKDPKKEYVELRATRDVESPVPISGWTLTNGKSEKIVQIVGPNAFNTGVSDRVTIPFGTVDVRTTGYNSKEVITLGKGEKAYVTTGPPPKDFPVPLNTSFKENICTGYFEQDENFSPSLKRKCPDPEEEAAGLLFDDTCQDFIDRLSRCKNPLLTAEDKIELETRLSNQCRAFLAGAYTYEACRLRHSSNTEYYLPTWRIYLGIEDRELWASRREKITLYDRNGLLVDELIFN